MAFIPPRPFGDTPEARGLQAIWDILWGPDSIFTDTLAIQFQKQATGKYIPKINLPMAKGEAPAVMMFAITTLNGGDFFSAKTWDGMSFGTSEVLIAKPPRQRTSVVSELMDGVTVNYSAYTNDNNRTANDGTNSELEVCYPRYMTMTDLGFDGYIATPPAGAALKLFNVSQCIVFAEQPANGTGCLDSDGKPILWLEKTARVWARKTGQ